MKVNRECHLERWEVDRQKEYFKNIFGYDLQCKVHVENSIEAPQVLEEYLV